VIAARQPTQPQRTSRPHPAGARVRWLSAGLVALLLSVTPLCGMACLDTGGDVAPSVTAEAGAPPVAHCHEAPADPAAAPRAATDGQPDPGTHQACACHPTPSMLSAAPSLDAPPLTLALAEPADAAFAGPRWLRTDERGAAARRARGLPPPDILLEKSTLLI